MNKLKIGIFTDSYRPYTSGVVRSIDTFVTELSKLGHEIYIFAPNYPGLKENRERRVFRFASIPAPTNPDFTLAVPFSLRLRQTLHILNLDIIHVHSPFILGRVGARQAKRLNIPLVFTFHTLYEEYVHYVPIAHNITKELTQKVCSEFCDKCSLIVTPTQIIGEHLKELGVKTPTINIPTGIHVEEYASGDKNWIRKNYNVNPENKILLCVGRLGKEKNLDWLLDSTALVAREYPHFHLFIVGGGPQEEELKEKAASLGIGERVTFTGVLPKEKVINCYNSADLFVFTSLTETQGLVIGEAKAAGLPSVAVKAYGISEMVEHGKDGFLTQLSKEEFADRVLLMLKNDDIAKQMSHNAKINAKKISARNCAIKLQECYMDLVQNNKNTAHGLSSS